MRPLVVALVVDQLAAEELLRAEPYLDGDGGLGRAIRGGIYYERARYPYAATLTAPGHASLFTGVPPAVHGVSANERWDRHTRTVVPATNDASARVLGSNAQLGPSALRAETVAEALVRQRGAQARVVSISIKDRGAIFPAGRAGIALWYEPADGAFTTSTAYVAELPGWLTAAEQRFPIERELAVWQPLDAATYARVLGPDDAPWESDMPGFGRAFPHDPKATPNPLGVLRFMPALSERQLRFAQLAVEQSLGGDEVPDLLLLSLSALDYTGHAFGPRSWEYLDHLRRIDRALGVFTDELAKRGPVTFVLSADHGIAPVPESIATVGEAGRIYTLELVAELEAMLAARFGVGPWVEACIGAFLYLAPKARERADVVALAEEWTSARPGMAHVFGVEDLRARAASLTDPLEARVALSLGPDIDADLYLVQEPGAVFDGHPRPGFGAHHGAPYAYDTDVPVLIWGTGIQARRTKEPVDALRFAATLSELLAIEPPSAARLPSLL